MALSDTAKNVMLTALAGEASHVSAHDGDPSTTGANELSGGVYARESITWASASGGSVSASNTPVIDIPGTDTVSWLGLWDAATTGNFLGGANVTDETYGADGTYTVTSFTISVT